MNTSVGKTIKKLEEIERAKSRKKDFVLKSDLSLLEGRIEKSVSSLKSMVVNPIL